MENGSRTVAAALIMTVLLPLIAGAVLHYGYLTNYTEDTFSRASFNGQYMYGPYAYRPLGRDVLKAVHRFVMPASCAPMDSLLHAERLLDLDENGDASFYHAYALTRTTGLIVLSILLWLLLRAPIFRLTLRGSVAVHASLLFLVALSLFVVTPYDLWTWSACLAAFLLLVRGSHSQRWLLLPLTFLAVLNHESSLLIPVIAGTLIYHERGPDAVRSPLLWMVLALWVVGYIAIRVLTDGWSTSLLLFFPENVMNRPLAGILISGVAVLALTVLVFSVAIDRTLLAFYSLLAAPYLLSVLLFGDLREFRLWTTYLLPLSLLSLFPLSPRKAEE